MSGSAGKEIDQLIGLMAKLPGLGPRSARRAVLQLVKKRTILLEPLARSMAEVAVSARECLTCGNVGTSENCDICTDPKRDTSLICVVSDVADLWAMERSAAFKGRYHVLGGVLSALDCVGPDQLHIPRLVNRVETGDVSEVVLALSATIDGQTTAHYIADQLESTGASVTSLAQGVPIGGELDYLDDGTITAALKSRKSF